MYNAIDIHLKGIFNLTYPFYNRNELDSYINKRYRCQRTFKVLKNIKNNKYFVLGSFPMCTLLSRVQNIYWCSSLSLNRVQNIDENIIKDKSQSNNK